jgi:hypothetical protein
MKLIRFSACLLAASAISTMAFAQDHSAFLKQVDGKAMQMKRCADIARALEKIPVPPKHAEAKNVAASNALIPDQKKHSTIDPVHKNFDANVRRMDQDLQNCGVELFKDLGSVEAKLKPFMEQVKKEKLPEAQMKAVSQSLGGYMKAKQDLQEAVDLLSKDVQMTAYVQKTLNEHYLNQKY